MKIGDKSYKNNMFSKFLLLKIFLVHNHFQKIPKRNKIGSFYTETTAVAQW